MAPTPRQRIVCYDLQTNSNARRIPDARYRVPLTGTLRKPKVTILPKDASEFVNARADACWHQDSYERDKSFIESENVPLQKLTERTRSHNTPHDKIVRLNSRHYNNKNLLDSKPSEFGSQPSGSYESASNRLNVANARHAYGQKLRQEQIEKERRLEGKRQRLAMQAQLDEIVTQLESFKRVYGNVLKTFGMSHNAAKYIQQQDDEFAKLKRKVDQFAETRSKELGQRVQQMKRFQEIQLDQDKRIEGRRLKDMSITTHCKHKWNSTLNNSLSSSNSPTTNTATSNTSSPSSTIPISSCSSPMSTDEQHIRSTHFVEPPTYQSTTSRSTKLPISTILSSSTPTSKRQHDIRKSSTLPETSSKEIFSFYKGNPHGENSLLEVTDIDFFYKVEDQTMLEVNELVNKMQSGLRDFNCELLQTRALPLNFDNHRASKD